MKRTIKKQFNQIPTHYKGHACRSRVEARWMVAFDIARIMFEYEPEGFDLPEVGKYLPDFYLPQVDMFAEVKADTFNLEELKKAQALATHTEKGVLLLSGTPSKAAYWGVHPKEGFSFKHEYKENSFAVMDYEIFEGSYWLHEKRFFANSGLSLDSFPDPRYSLNSPDDDNLYEPTFAARSARFEYGECGYTKQSEEHFKNRELERNRLFQEDMEKHRNETFEEFLKRFKSEKTTTA